MIILGDEKEDGPMARRKQDIIRIDSYEPNADRKCENCGRSPTVTAVTNGRKIVDFDLCGPCWFEDEKAIDPKTWNDQEV